MYDSDPHHIRAARAVQEWNQDLRDADARQRQYELNNGGRKGFGGGSSDGRFFLSAWVFLAGLMGFILGMTMGDGEFLPMMGYGLLVGGACAALMQLLRVAVGGGLFVLGLTLLGIKKAIGGVFGLLAGKTFASGGGAIARSAFRGGAVGGLVGAGIALFLQDSVGDAALRVGMIGAGIGVFLRVLSMARGKDTSV